MSKKTIEQQFEKKFGDKAIIITARNYNSHIVSINGNQMFFQKPDEIVSIAKFLTETAETIKNDKDFNS